MMTNRRGLIRSSAFATARTRPHILPSRAGDAAGGHSRQPATRAAQSSAPLSPADPCLDHLLLEWYGNENGDGIVIISHAGTVAHVNDRFRQLWQVDPATRLNIEADVWNAVTRLVDEPPAVLEQVTAFGLDSVASAKWTWRLTNGGAIECRTAPLTQEGGARESRIWSFHEVGTNRPLEDHVLHAQRLEIIGTVACQLTHEIRNALAPIMSAVELAQQALPPDHRANNHLGQIARAAGHVGDLVQKVLCFGRRGTEPPQRNDLGTIVRESIDLLSAALPRTVSIQTHLEPAPAILADAREIQQVLMNLCINAWHAIEPGTGTITIEVVEERVAPRDNDDTDALPPGRYVHLSVSDNGRGMDEQTLQQIFRPFYTTKPASNGTGLGLAVVRTIAQSHGARISVDSALGRGTTFHLRFRPAGEL